MNLFYPLLLSLAVDRGAGKEESGFVDEIQTEGLETKREDGSTPASESLKLLRLRALQLEGRKQVSEREIRSILKSSGLTPGVLLNWPEDERVREARSRLVATGYFSRVTMRIEMHAGNGANGTDLAKGALTEVALILELEERGSLTVREVYLANSTLIPFHGGIELQESNFLGKAVHLGIAGIWGTKPSSLSEGRSQQGYSLDAVLPVVGNSRLSILGKAYYLSASEPFRVAGYRDQSNPQFHHALNYDRIGGTIGLSLGLGNDVELSASYRLESIKSDDPDVSKWERPDGELRDLDLALSSGLHRLGVAGFSFQWDQRPQLRERGHGGRFRIDLELSSGASGSRYDYLKVLIAGAYSIRLPWNHWLTPSVSGGQIAGDAPRFERFHPGDLADWTPGRELGLLYSTRLPVDVFGTGTDGQGLGVIGGRADLEYTVPLFRRTRTSFVYGGNIFFSAGVFAVGGTRKEQSERISDGLRRVPIGMNANAGLRLDTSIGEFEFSIGNLLRRLPL